MVAMTRALRPRRRPSGSALPPKIAAPAAESRADASSPSAVASWPVDRNASQRGSMRGSATDGAGPRGVRSGVGRAAVFPSVSASAVTAVSLGGVEVWLQVAGSGIPVEYLSMAPYLITILVLVIMSAGRKGKASGAPAALGQNFHASR